jgi:co-chaperonin GroES (HSP10)
MSEGAGTLAVQTEAEAFPNIDPGFIPLGGRVLIQLRTPRTKSKGGIIMTSDTVDTETWNDQLGKVVALGPLAYRNRETGLPWVEDIWVTEGDFVRIARWNGDRVTVTDPDTGEKARFVTFNDHEIISKYKDAATAMRQVNYVL